MRKLKSGLCLDSFTAPEGRQRFAGKKEEKWGEGASTEEVEEDKKRRRGVVEEEEGLQAPLRSLTGKAQAAAV